MGSFSSKVRSIRYGVNLRETTNENIISGNEDECCSTTDASVMMENSTNQGQDEGTNGNESNAGAIASHGKHSVPRVHQSFAWLASPPVVLNTAANEQKEKGERPVEGKIKSSNVMKYSNGKYLKSWRHSSEKMPERKPQGDASSSSSTSPSADSKGKYVNKDRSSEGSKKQNVNQARSRPGNTEDFSSSRAAGYGLLPQQSSPSTSARPTVRFSPRETLPLKDKEKA